jgi:serine/threonine protein kinase
VAELEAHDIIADPVEKIACRKCGRHLDVSKLASFSKVECPDCHTKQTVPAQFGPFLLLELLGAGGMGAVYQALDQQLGRYVAIKVMKRAMGDDPHFVENFLREARAAAALNHRNVVQIYSCGQEKGQPYIVMELVSGGRFDQMIATGNALDEVRVLEIGLDVAEGLKAANDIGLIHGDVKPANVLFDKEGIAKVADFGLARFVAWQQDRGEIWGTPYYIAPEKARGQRVDHRSDIYSLGATLYHALGAKPPFDGKTATDVVLARLKNPAIGLRVIRPTLQPETADVIARMLESDPFMRYPTYASVLADLKEALRVAKHEQRSVHSLKAKKQTMSPGMSVFIMVLVVAAVVLTGYFAMHRGKPEEVAAEDLVDTNDLASSSTDQVASVQQAQPQDTSSKRVVPVIQPFTLAGEQAIAAAVDQMVKGNPAGMREQLQVLYDKSPPIGMGRYWIRLFQAVACWGGGRDKDARLYLQEIRNTMFESTDPTQPHPGRMPQALARYTLKEVEEGAVSFEAARWPPWYGDLAEFFMGLDYLREGNLAKATDFFKSYLSRSGTSPMWPYNLQPVAKLCVDQITDYTDVRQKVSGLLEAKQAAKAKTLLDDFKFKSSSLLWPVIDQDLAKARLVEVQGLAEQARAERKAHQEKVQADLDKLDAVRAANLSLVSLKDFRKASAAVIKLVPEMTTNEGQQALMNLRDAYDRMDLLKKFLINRISAAPFRGGVGTELGGDAVGADLNGIRIALGSHGEMVKPWEEVSPRLLLQVANYYLADTAVTAKERADAAFATALYCYESGGFKPAQAYVEQALKLDPELKVKIRKMMPDILSD